MPTKMAKGALIDNDKRVGIVMLEESDREDPQAARAVFNALFWTAHRVIITSVWQVMVA